MYSYEIDSYLRENNFSLNIQQFDNICDTSTQIQYIKLIKENEKCSEYSFGTNDNSNWNVFVNHYK